MLISMESLALALDEELLALVDDTPTVIEFIADDVTQVALINDLATGINKPSVVAARFGLTPEQLYNWVKIPEARRRIKARKAVWESEANLPERNKIYWGNVTLEAAPVADKMIHEPSTPAHVRVKLIEVAGRLGGVDVKPNPGEGGPVAERFSVVFQFSGGMSERVTIVNPPEPLTIDGDPVS
jgi:hypothetical protein